MKRYRDEVTDALDAEIERLNADLRKLQSMRAWWLSRRPPDPPWLAGLLSMSPEERAAAADAQRSPHSLAGLQVET